jgi:hypothetical protein
MKLPVSFVDEQVDNAIAENLPAIDSSVTVNDEEDEEQETSGLCSDCCSSSKQRSNCRVHFDSTIEVRTYAVILGDHPVTKHFPMELSWCCTPTETISLEDYEANRSDTPTLPLTIMQRQTRLSKVTGRTISELKEQERQRQVFESWFEDDSFFFDDEGFDDFLQENGSLVPVQF